MKARAIKREIVKNTASIVVIIGLILCCAEDAPGTSLLDFILWHGGCLAAVCLAALPLNRICEIEERAERIRKIRQTIKTNANDKHLPQE